MSFRIEDLMVSVMPLAACGDVTKSDDDNRECGNDTKPGGGTGGTKHAEADLALLKAQLRQALENRV